MNERRLLESAGGPRNGGNGAHFCPAAFAGSSQSALGPVADWRLLAVLARKRAMALHAEPVQHKPEYRLAHSRRNLFQSHPDGFPGMRATMSAKRRPPSCYLRGLFLIAVQRSKLDEHDRLAVADLSAADHVERLLDSDLGYLDILALFQLVAAQPFAVGGAYFATKKKSFLAIDPGLMKASETGCGFAISKPVSSATSARIASAA